MINFAEIKTQLVEKGLAYPVMAENATQKYIVIEGVWNRDQTTEITKVGAGWKIGDFVKTLPVNINIPAINKQNIESVKSQLEQDHNATIIFKIY